MSWEIYSKYPQIGILLDIWKLFPSKLESLSRNRFSSLADVYKRQDYVYTISVQGHGAYPDEPLLEDPEIEVTGAKTDAENNKWEYYANEIHEMDKFVAQLVKALEDYDEDVVLVMYGDHLPTMGLEVEDLRCV